MFTIASNGIITVNRVTLLFGCVGKPTRYELQDSDRLYLGIMEPNQPFETAIVRKMLKGTDVPNGRRPVFRFWPEDTACLLPGKYYYQIKIETLDPQYNRYDVETIVDKTLFYIQE